jgi:hypothetical protein
VAWEFLVGQRGAFDDVDVVTGVTDVCSNGALVAGEMSRATSPATRSTDSLSRQSRSKGVACVRRLYSIISDVDAMSRGCDAMRYDGIWRDVI